MGLRIAVLFLVFATPAVYAASHTVGGSSGWNTGVDYTTWAKGETFNVGDTLEFSYGSSHGVDVVSQDDYNNCNTGNAQPFSGGSTTVKLTTPGPMYFVCSNSFHCGSGMKLAINVNGAGGGSSITNPPSTSTPTTPSGSSPTTPSSPSGSTTTPSTSSPTGDNAATGSFGSINPLMIGISLAFAALFIRA